MFNGNSSVIYLSFNNLYLHFCICGYIIIRKSQEVVRKTEELLLKLNALADETRLRIVNILRNGELCVCQITEVLGISQSKASRHLSILKTAGIVADRRQAQWVYYSLINKQPDFFFALLQDLEKIKEFQDDLSKVKLSVKPCC